MNASVEQAKDLLRQLFVWDTAEKQQILRAATAKGYGLSPDQYARPFPGSSNVTIMNIGAEPQPAATPTTAEPPADAPTVATTALPVATPASPSRTPWGMLAALAGMAGTGLAGAGLNYLLTSRPPAVTAKSTEVTNVKDVDLVVKWKLGADGQWHTWVEPAEGSK